MGYETCAVIWTVIRAHILLDTGSERILHMCASCHSRSPTPTHLFYEQAGEIDTWLLTAEVISGPLNKAEGRLT